MKPSRADIFHLLVRARREVRDRVYPVRAEIKGGPLCLEKSHVLLDEGVLRLGQYPDEVVLSQGLQLDPYRKSPLKLGYEVGRLGDVKRPGGYEEYVVRLHHSVFGVHDRTLDYGKKVPLNSFPRHVRPVSRAFPRDLVYLVYEDNARLLYPLDRAPRHLVHVD